MSDQGRHSRHTLFEGIGREGQKRLERARVAVIGCGALGTRSAELLARAGVSRDGGQLTIIDRDYVDITNLQRQTLFDEADARDSMPKAEAARRHLLKIDSALRIDIRVRDLNGANATLLLRDFDLLIDGSDNFPTRFVVNDAALVHKVPWIYGGAVGSRGMVAMISPPHTPCFRCYLESLPPVGSADTCDTAGIITPLPSMVAALQVSIALRFLVEGTIVPGVTMLDLWRDPGESRRLLRSLVPDPDCRSCGLHQYPALGKEQEQLVPLCGRNSVQIYSATTADLDRVASSLGKIVAVIRHETSLTAEIPEGKITLFQDGRIVVEGTTDPQEARTIAARYLG